MQLYNIQFFHNLHTINFRMRHMTKKERFAEISSNYNISLFHN